MANEEAWQPLKSDKSERLFQLTCVLLYSERGVTKRELFHAVDSYREDLKATPNDETAVHKKFERDKSDLRQMGIQINGFEGQIDSDDMRYTIASDTFFWPEGIEFNAEQLQLLNLAAQVWAQASLSSEANRGLVRLKALGLEPAASDILGFAPRLRTHEPSFLPLSEAIEDHIEVVFDYRKPDGEVTQRKVQPWLLRNVDGQWLLVCWDKDRKAVRNFLLKRIVSRVIPRTLQLNDKEVELVKFEAPSAQSIAAALEDLEQHTRAQRATLRVKKDSQAWFHFHLDGKSNLGIDSSESPATAAQADLVELSYMDLQLLAEELSDYVLDIEVLQPPDLSIAINKHFEAVLAAHA